MPTFVLGKVVGPAGPQGEPGPAGPQGIQGPAYTLNDTDKNTIAAAVKASLTTETWTFTLEDGSTVTKAVYVGEIVPPTVSVFYFDSSGFIIECRFEKGMTWEEYCESSYNEGFTVFEDGVYWMTPIKDASGVGVIGTDAIIEGMTYHA